MKRTIPVFLSLAAVPVFAQPLSPERPAIESDTFVEEEGTSTPTGASSSINVEAAPATVVTATRLDDPIERIPAAISVVTAEEIEERGHLSFEEALRSTPGVSITRSGGYGHNASIFMRGTGSNHTRVLFDGVPVNDPSSSNGAFDFSYDGLASVGQIEIVRGPGSALHGSSAIGGVINFIPAVGADKAFAPFGEVAIGSEGLFMGAVGARGSLERVDYGFAIEGLRTDGHNLTPHDHPSNTGERDGFDSVSFTGRFEAEPTDMARIDGVFRFRDSTVATDAGELVPPYGSIDTAFDEKTTNQQTLWRLGGEIDLLDAALTPRIDIGQVFFDREVFLEAGDDRYEGELSFINAQVTGRLGDFGAVQDVTLTGGLQYEEERIDIATAWGDPFDANANTVGYFMQAQALAFDRVDLSAQVRQEEPDDFAGETTWRLGAVIDVPEINGRIFGAVGTAFKAPTLYQRYVPIYGNPDLQAETAFSWEIGGEIDISAQGRSDYVTLGLTWFSSAVENLITADPENNWRNINLDEAEIDGLEALAIWRAADWAEASLSYTWTDARDGSTGERLVRRPEHMATLSATLQPLAGFTLAPEIQYVGAQEDAGGRIDPITLVNVSTSYEFIEGVEIFGRISNLFDEDYQNPIGFQGRGLNGLIGVRAQL